MELGNLLFGHSRGQYKVPRGFTENSWEWDDRFAAFFLKFQMNQYGYAINPQYGYRRGVVVNNRGGITTPVFEVNPYYWGEDEAEMDKPNFLYYPTGFELRWYKYPLRDAYANQVLSFQEFGKILNDCERYGDV